MSRTGPKGRREGLHTGLHSMTGFGRASLERNGACVDVEIRSVNNRHLTCKCRMPSALQRFEKEFEERVRKKASRGSFDITARVRLPASPVRPVVDTQLAADYARVIDAFLEGQSRAEGVSAEFLLGLPGVMSIVESPDEFIARQGMVMTAIDTALVELVAMRAAEGARLCAELGKRVQRVARLVDRIDKRSPRVTRDYQKRLNDRLSQLLGNGPLAADDESLRREVAYFAERADVTEEIERLRSHLTHFTGLLEGKGSVGRQLEFVVQEMGREINTIGSKANDALVSRLVVQVKAEFEKLREQVQNIE